MTIQIGRLEDWSPVLKEREEFRSKLVSKRDGKKREFYHYTAMRSDGQNPDRTSRVDDIANGRELTPTLDYTALLKDVEEDWGQYDQAVEVHDRATSTIRREVAREFCASIKNEHDIILARLAKSLVEAHEANRELFEIETGLHNFSIGCHGVCTTSPREILGNPTDCQSPLADLLNEMVKAGALTKLPESLRYAGN